MDLIKRSPVNLFNTGKNNPTIIHDQDQSNQTLSLIQWIIFVNSDNGYSSYFVITSQIILS